MLVFAISYRQRMFLFPTLTSYNNRNSAEGGILSFKIYTMVPAPSAPILYLMDIYVLSLHRQLQLVAHGGVESTACTKWQNFVCSPRRQHNTLWCEPIYQQKNKTYSCSNDFLNCHKGQSKLDAGHHFNLKIHRVSKKRPTYALL